MTLLPFRSLVSSFRFLILFFFLLPASAHDLPLSYIDVRLQEKGIDVTVESTSLNFARALQDPDAATLLERAQVAPLREKLQKLLSEGLVLSVADKIFFAEFGSIEPLPARRSLRLHLHYPPAPRGALLRLQCRLFADTPLRRTFVNLYRDDLLQTQGIFDRATTQIDLLPDRPQSVTAVIWQFLVEGTYHIFIGPDHILFIIGLLLLGGTLRQLLQIVTAFTLAHSLTLVLAALGILNPSPRLIEPIIALSIIFVGAHALLASQGKRDTRLLYAFLFGFIHGFGFANVLREMHLPRAALGWSLGSFNLGVEIGQACIVLTIAPLLGWIYRKNALAARRLVAFCAFGVIFAGSYWFTQRVFS